ncbi:MAG: carbon-nitrogen hydrolase family protein [Saprospiraceae bacterium]|nr:carbon-nitrogen hydrolase family protein [Saprospiraceae bacterium]
MTQTAWCQVSPGPGKLRVAASQFPVSADIDSNAIWIQHHMAEARSQSCDVVHFPECALSGYAGVDHQSLDNFNWEKLKSKTKDIIHLADSLDIWVILGSTHPLSPGNKPHNCLYVIDPDGKVVDRYDKRFCTTGDLKYYTAGNHFVEFEINEIKCGLLICYDVRFPELYRAYQKEGVRVLFQSFYNARQKPGSIHPVIMPLTAQARAATNSFYMSLTNSSAQHSWPCHFITPDGLIAGKLDADMPGLLVSDIDISARFYDASAPFRPGAMQGVLSSGEAVKDPKSVDRTSY